MAHNTMAMASIDSSAQSRDLSVADVSCTQQQSTGLVDNSGAQKITSLQVLRRVDHSNGRTHIIQGHDEGTDMVAHLPRDGQSLRSQEQARFPANNGRYSHQSIEHSVHIPWAQTPAKSAIPRQFPEASTHTSSPEAPVHSVSQKMVSSQQLSQDSSSTNVFRSRNSSRSTVSDQPLQHHQLASKLATSSHMQPQIGSQQMEESNNHHLYQMLMDIHHPTQYQIGSYQTENVQKPDMPQTSSDMFSFESELGTWRNQQTLNRPVPHMAIDDWQNGLQAGSRPAFWDQCRQNFGISQHVQPEPSAQNMPSDFCTSTTLFPQLHLGSGGQFRSQQFGTLQGWPGSYDEGARVEPFLNHPFSSTFDMPSQMVFQSNAQRANPDQGYQRPVLPAPMPVGRTGPAAMHTLPPALKSSNSLSKPQLSSAGLTRLTPDNLYTTPQPPIGTPRAAGPKLITAAVERTTGQPLHNEPSIPLLPYYPGSDVMYPHAKQQPSEALRLLTAHGRPSIDQLLDRDVVPFMKGGEKNEAGEWGVIRIGNIPYSLTRAEVVSFLGPEAKVIPPTLGTGVHIIMERTTGKTMDCYVEFVSVYEAQIAVNHLVYRGHPLRLGTPPHDRVVNVTMSSQDELMKQLFPRAKNVVWVGGKPVIQASNEPFNTGFKTFITGEELVMMSKHAEQPHRSSYIQRCPQRTYECMISTLAKFPWYAVDHYTLGTREQIFNATRDMLRHLVFFLKRGGLANVNYNLLFEYMITGLNAAGFSERQRWELVQAAEHTGQSVRISPLAQWWPWEALGRRPGIEEDVVQYYAHLITLHPTLQQTAMDAPAQQLNPFGGSVEHDSIEITLAEAAVKEWELFEAILRDVLRESQRA